MYFYKMLRVRIPAMVRNLIVILTNMGYEFDIERNKSLSSKLSSWYEYTVGKELILNCE